MGKQNKQKKIKLPGFSDDLKETVFRRLMIAAVALLFAATVFFLVKAFLYKSDYFKLRVVETRAAFLDRTAAGMISNQVLSLYKGQNMFKIPLQFIARSIQTSYADVKDVTARIALPDRLVVDIKLRKPIALVRNNKYYPIDEEGVVLPALAASGVMTDLPAIDGIDLKYGRKNTSRNLRLAMDLLREIRQAKFMAPLGVISINAADPRNMSFFLKSGLEVKIGSENFKDRLDALAKTLKDPRLIIDRIKYIDVRFEDVAIGPK
jgi:cell division septal protein FtsQ